MKTIFIPSRINNVEENDSWENTDSDLKIIELCGRVEQKEVDIILSRTAKRKIDLLMKKFPNTEWLAYLKGSANNYYVKDLYIPKQNATSGNVDRIEITETIPDMIGVIHSHHTMGAFFSGTDKKYVNSNHDISIVVSTTGYKAQVRLYTPCGFKLLVNGNIKIEEEVLFNETDFFSNVDSQISNNVGIRYTNRIFPSVSDQTREQRLLESLRPSNIEINVTNEDDNNVFSNEENILEKTLEKDLNI